MFVNTYVRISNPREEIQAGLWMGEKNAGVQWEGKGKSRRAFVITRLNKVKVYIEPRRTCLMYDQGHLFPLAAHVFDVTYERVYSDDD